MANYIDQFLLNNIFFRLNQLYFAVEKINSTSKYTSSQSLIYFATRWINRIKVIDLWAKCVDSYRIRRPCLIISYEKSVDPHIKDLLWEKL